MNTESNTTDAPLAGVRVIEMGQLIAGPFAGKTLGDFGADVIKIEAPDGGDPLRNWRMMKEGTSVWWQVQSRNKRSLALDLRSSEGQEIARKLVAEADVLIENFRPGTLEGWGMGWDVLSQLNPGLIMLRISGYGQTGPYRDLPGFGMIGEAMGGLRHLTGEPGRVPVRCGVSIGDTLAALHGVIGILTALYHRKVNGGQGQVIDVALHEAVFNVMESLIPEYSAFGAVREPGGSALPGIAPSNAYRCRDGIVLVAGNGDSIFKRLMLAIGRPDLAEAPDLANNAGRVARVDEIDGAIGAWTAEHGVAEVLDTLGQARVPAGKVYTARDIAEDPHYRARDMILTQTTRDGYDVEVPGIVPKLMGTPGGIRSAAPHLGEDTDAVLREVGLTEEQIAALRARGVVACSATPRPPPSCASADDRIAARNLRPPMPGHDPGTIRRQVEVGPLRRAHRQHIGLPHRLVTHDDLRDIGRGQHALGLALAQVEVAEPQRGRFHEAGRDLAQAEQGAQLRHDLARALLRFDDGGPVEHFAVRGTRVHRHHVEAAVAREPQRHRRGAQHGNAAGVLAPGAEGAEQRRCGLLAGRVGTLAARAEQALEAQFAVRAGPVGQGQLACPLLDETLQYLAFGVLLERAFRRRQAGNEAQRAGRVIHHGPCAVRQVDHRVVVALLQGAAVVVRAAVVFL